MARLLAFLLTNNKKNGPPWISSYKRNSLLCVIATFWLLYQLTFIASCALQIKSCVSALIKMSGCFEWQLNIFPIMQPFKTPTQKFQVWCNIAFQVQHPMREGSRKCQTARCRQFYWNDYNNSARHLIGTLFSKQ